MRWQLTGHKAGTVLIEDDLTAIACPTLVLSGAEDSVSPSARQEALAAAIPGARLELLDGVGHYAPLEASEAVAAALVSWLR